MEFLGFSYILKIYQQTTWLQLTLPLAMSSSIHLTVPFITLHIHVLSVSKFSSVMDNTRYPIILTKIVLNSNKVEHFTKSDVWNLMKHLHNNMLLLCPI